VRARADVVNAQYMCMVPLQQGASSQMQAPPPTPRISTVTILPQTPSQSPLLPNTVSTSPSVAISPTTIAVLPSISSDATSPSTDTALSTNSAPLTGTAPPTSQQFTGQATYYDVGLGSCGIESVSTDLVVAVSQVLYDQYATDGNPNHNSLCNRKARATLSGNSVDVTIVDRCGGCQLGDLDFSDTAFLQLVDGLTLNSNTGKGIGRASGMTWQMV